MNNIKIIDNQRKNLRDTLIHFLPKFKTISIATGYWDLPGMQMIFEQLKDYKKIRLLIGREPLLPRYKQTKPEPDYPDQDFFDDLEQMQPTRELKELVSNIKKMIADGNLEVKVYRQNFLHAKCYILGDYSTPKAIGIIGSSNFTKNWLTANTELNALESDHRIVTFQPQTAQQEVGHLFWFDWFWEKAENWDGQFTEILGYSPVGDVLFTPYETYIKTLYEIYKEELLEEEYQPNKNGAYELFDFQKKNVQQLLQKLKHKKVALLSDSVGLGKTITAIEVIKNYYDQNGKKERVVVVCPKSLENQWQKELDKEKISISPVVLQNPEKINREMKRDKFSSVALFVIDESHNLRKTNGSRYETMLKWIRQNKEAHVLMLTATPINNEISDLTNQILLGTRGKGDVIKLFSNEDKEKPFYEIIKNLEKDLKNKLKKGKKINYEEIKNKISPIIRNFVVRRTRQGIEKEYGKLKINGQIREFPQGVVEKQGYHFPTNLINHFLKKQSPTLFNAQEIFQLDTKEIIEKTTNLKHPLDQIDKIKNKVSEEYLQNESPIYFIFQLILMLGFIPYRRRIYQHKYYGKSITDIQAMKLNGDENIKLQQQRWIYGIFRTVFLKRLESSVYAIKISLGNYTKKLELFEKYLAKGKIIKMKDFKQLNDSWETIEEDTNLDNLFYNNGEKIELEDADEINFNLKQIRLDIAKEKSLITFIIQLLELTEKDDPKIKALDKLINKIKTDYQESGQKILIFSYFSDTLEYLKNNILELSNGILNEENTAFLSSKNRLETESFVERFAPTAQEYEIKEDEKELQHLFCTDVLSEGQNLQDCGILINYDLHWNPVRMIQRNWRINRLGSKFKKVVVFNMSPEIKIESYLHLVKRLENKIDLIRFTIGTDQSVLGEIAKPVDYINNIKDLYSDDEIKRFNANKKLEEAEDFLLAEDNFITDLEIFNKNPNFTKEYKQKIYWIPQGKLALFPTDGNLEKRPEILVLNKLFLKNGEDEENQIEENIQFFKMNKNGEQKGVVSYLTALSWLKTKIKETTQQSKNILKNNLDLNYDLIKENAENKIHYQKNKKNEKKLNSQHEKILEILMELSYDISQIELLEKAFNTNNVLDIKKMNKLVRQINTAKKNNTPYNEQIKTLLKIAQKNIEEETDTPNQIKNIKTILIYSQ